MKLRLATDRNFMVNGEWKRKTAWHRAVYFGTDVDRYLDLSKGQWVTLEGSIEYSQSEGRDGTKRYWTDIIAHKLIAEGHQETDPDDTSDPDRMPF
jgi:single-stranded DNA-binding protein